MRTARTLLVFALAAALGACSAAEKTPTKYPATIHPGDTPKFPAEAAGFEREEVVAFAEGMKNVAATYGHLTDDLQIAATLTYVPQEGSNDIAKRYEAEKKTSLEFHPGARWLKEEDLVLEKKGVSYPAKKSTYEFEGMFRGQRQQLYAEVYLWSYGDGWIVLRATSPSWQRKKATPKNLELIQAVDWAS